MLKLQTYFNQVEIDEMTASIAKYEENIDDLSCFAPEGCGNIPWPLGVPAPFKPPTRFDVLRWDFFNETHIYLKTDDAVIEPMKCTLIFEIPIRKKIRSLLCIDEDYEDVHEVINHAVEQFQKKHGNKYEEFDRSMINKDHSFFSLIS